MPIYEFGKSSVSGLQPITFHAAGLQERRDLQRLLREQISVIAPNVLVIAEEFGDWDESNRRIDLLGIDHHANIVVIELKRTEDGGHMELQAIRYAAMVSQLTFDQAVEAFEKYLSQLGKDEPDPRTRILDFLGWDEPDEDHFGKDVRIVLASAEFSKEITSSVLWLLDRDVDICCVRLKPYDLEGRVLVDVQQIIPLPEAREYQIQVREKARKERESRESSVDFTRFDVRIGDQEFPNQWKNHAILAVCRCLCERGVNPDEIAETIGRPTNRVWRSVPGTLDASSFSRVANEKHKAGEWHYSERRWFCADDQLIHFNGSTYAFLNQWGGANWHRAMGILKEKYPQFAISFSPV